MKNKNLLVSLLLIIILFTSMPSYGAEDKTVDQTKTIVIVLDELDLKSVDQIVDNYYGLGFLNIKGKKPTKSASLFMSINSGRKLSVDGTKFKGIEKNEEELIIKNYSELYDDLLKRNNNLKISLLNDKLMSSFIGNDSVALLAANSEGIINAGENKITYEKKWLSDKTLDALDKTDILYLSYKIENLDNRRALLKDYINTFRNNNILVIPRSMNKSMGSLFNKNLTPILYLKDGQNGLLTSNSTRREGIITVEDLNSEILDIYGYKGNNIGHLIKFDETKDVLTVGNNLYNRIFNLLLIAIVFQTFVYLNQGYVCFNIIKKRDLKTSRYTNRFILINIIVALILSLFNLHKYLIVYLIVNLLLTYLLSLNKRYLKDEIGLISTIIYLLISLTIFLRPNAIYNSYLGFNNLFYGARYYGFNNGIMGIYLVSSILAFYYLNRFVKNRFYSNLLLLGIFGLNIIVLSTRNAANTGGFITSVILLLTMIYLKFFEKKIDFKKVILLILIGIIIFTLNIYFDGKGSQGHAFNFFRRIKESGISEFINMTTNKLVELVKYTLLPPFSIIIVAQIFSIRELTKYMSRKLKRVSGIIFFISIIAFLINDTGMISFIFINQFNIANIISKTKIPINKQEVEYSE